MKHYAGGRRAKPPSLSEPAALWREQRASTRPGLTGKAALNSSPSSAGPASGTGGGRACPALGQRPHLGLPAFQAGKMRASLRRGETLGCDSDAGTL